MKKQYMKPDMQAVKIELCNMIAESINRTNVGVNVSEGGTSGGHITTSDARERGLNDFNLSNDLW